MHSQMPLRRPGVTHELREHDRTAPKDWLGTMARARRSACAATLDRFGHVHLSLLVQERPRPD